MMIGELVRQGLVAGSSGNASLRLPPGTQGEGLILDYPQSAYTTAGSGQTTWSF